MEVQAVTILFSVVILLSLSNQSLDGVEANRLLLQNGDDEIERQLKILNKPPIKSIQTKVGDIFDCIDIYKQPAFDHPLLKNHKLQMEPSLVVNGIKNEIPLYDAKIPKTMFEIHSEKCPSGTVPIRRTTKQDLVNAKCHTEMRNSYRATTSFTLTTGCFNVNCPGFVQVHSTIALGDALDNISEYGRTQHLTNVTINRNPVSGNWWLLGNDNTVIGYWPKEIFPRLDNASVVRYGGEAGENSNSPIPPMGNGNFPDKDYSKAAFMIQMKVSDWRHYRL
ncbi:hypothetical protein MKX01_038477 [Papaver californicum]|nr:hypothetical protein MKX01_038477 [Papaver californicum]